MGQGTLLFRASLGDVLRAERMRQRRPGRRVRANRARVERRGVRPAGRPASPRTADPGPDPGDAARTPCWPSRRRSRSPGRSGSGWSGCGSSTCSARGRGGEAPGPNVGRILEAMAAGTRPVLYDHELEPVDLLYVEDAVRACLLAADEVPVGRRACTTSPAGRAVRAEDVVARLERPARDGPAAGPGRPVFDDPAGRCRTSAGPGSNSGSRPTIDLDEGLRRCVETTRPAAVAIVQ